MTSDPIITFFLFFFATYGALNFIKDLIRLAR